MGQAAALAGVFGVEPSYLLDRGEPPLGDGELMDALQNGAVREATLESSRSPERRMLLGIVRQLGERETSG